MANFDKVAKLYDSFLFRPYTDKTQKWCLGFLENFLISSRRILDIGCGTGSFFTKLKNRDSLELFGIDESGEMIRRAQKKFKNIKFIVGKAEDLPFQENYFDLAVITGSFHYFSDPEKSFSECHRVLQKGGTLAITSPVCDNFFQRFRMEKIDRFLHKIFFSDFKKNCKYLSLSDFKALGEKHKFHLIKIDTKFFEGVNTRLVIFGKM